MFINVVGILVGQNVFKLVSRFKSMLLFCLVEIHLPAIKWLLLLLVCKKNCFWFVIGSFSQFEFDLLNV